MPGLNKNRKRPNTIAFHVSNEEKMAIETRINVSGLPKSEFYIGSCLGNKLEMIGGKFNPSGKLTISFPRHSAQTPCYYNQYEGWHGGQYVDLEKGYVYEFGDGLSYSEFEYSNLRLSQNTIKNEEEITVSVDVTNKGNMDGKETVLMFVNDVISSVLTPTKQLKGFEKVFIKSGETVTVNLKLNIKDLAIVTRDLEYIVEKGKFEIMVGRNTKEYLKDILSVEENIKL